LNEFVMTSALGWGWGVLWVANGKINRLASMFTAVVTSLVSDILLPPLSVLLPLNKNLEEKFAVLRPGGNMTEGGYNTLKQAQDDGAVVMAYGLVFLPHFCSVLPDLVLMRRGHTAAFS